MPKVYVPHRIPPEARLTRIVTAGIATHEQVDALVLAHHSSGRVDLEAVVTAALGDNEPPWTHDVSGKLQLAIEDDQGEPTGEMVELVIVDGIVDVPDEHLAHVLAGVHGSHEVVDG